MATFRGQDGSATFDGTSIENLLSWSLDGNLAAIDTTVKGDKHQKVRGGRASGTGQLVARFDTITGQNKLIDEIAAAAPGGAAKVLVVLADTGELFTVDALVTHFQVTSPDGDGVCEATFDLTLSSDIVPTRGV